MIGLLMGTHVLVVGIADREDGALKVYVDARWKNLYVVVVNPEDQAKVRAAWGAAMGHVTIPKPDPDQLFVDEPEPTAEHDCGHACCDTPEDPFHDHFLAPTDCPRCEPSDGYAAVDVALGDRGRLVL